MCAREINVKEMVRECKAFIKNKAQAKKRK